MARPIQEVAFGLHRRLQALQHRVERLGQRVEFIPRCRHGQASFRFGHRDGVGLATHPLDRTQGRARQRPSQGGRQRQGGRTADQQLHHQSRKCLVAIVERASHHHEGSVRARGTRQHTNGQGHARRPRFGERRAMNGLQRAGCQERVGCERGGEGNDLAGSVDDLRERVIRFDDRAVRRQGLAPIGGRRYELGLGEQALIDRFREVSSQPGMDERPERDQHQGHAGREPEGEPPSQREASRHACPLRRPAGSRRHARCGDSCDRRADRSSPAGSGRRRPPRSIHRRRRNPTRARATTGE